MTAENPYQAPAYVEEDEPTLAEYGDLRRADPLPQGDNFGIGVVLVGMGLSVLIISLFYRSDWNLDQSWSLSGVELAALFVIAAGLAFVVSAKASRFGSG